VSNRYQPRDLEHARQIIAAYNRLSAKDARITEVLALFRREQQKVS
jgi:hypothetical protein